MADAMIRADKKPEKSLSEDDCLKLDDEDALLFDKPREQKGRGKAAKTSKPAASGKAPSSRASSSKTTGKAGVSGDNPKADTNDEVLGLLKAIQADNKKTNERIDHMNQRIDALYNDYEEDHDYDDNQDYDYDQYDDDIDNEGGVSDEPPRKKQKPDDAGNSNEKSRFDNMGKKFKAGEKCAPPLNDQLAKNITDIFRNGIAQDRLSELMKDDRLKRPENCEGLVTVQTDQVIWDILSLETKQNDNKMKNIQCIVAKTATVMSKVINELGQLLEEDDNQEMSKMFDDCMDALALMGHANRLTCLMRRTLMKHDIVGDYGHLLNATVPFDKHLFGGDVAKTVDDIGKCSRISTKIRGRGSYNGGYSFGRGYGRGGRRWFSRGRGAGRGRFSDRGRGNGRPNMSVAAKDE